MKRNIFALGLLSLCCAAFFVGESQAWHFWHHHKYVTHITCRPYNAFTPICWGNLTCDGCCPSFGCGGNQMPMMMNGPCFGGACGPHMAAAPMHNGPMMPPAAGAPNFTPPPPMPLPMGPNTTMYPPMDLSQVNYMPTYPQYYMPQYPMPNYGYGYSPYMNMHYAPAPAYWYGR